MQGEEFTIIRFADESGISLDSSEATFNETLNTLGWFKNVSGLKVNVDRTSIF